MILTGKAKEDFFKWYKESGSEGINVKNYSLNIAHSITYAVIIDWFDSVGIWDNIFYREYRNTGFKNYSLATTEAIKKANEIYNNKK